MKHPPAFNPSASAQAISPAEGPTIFAAADLENISQRPLNFQKIDCRPQNEPQYLTVKELAKMFSVSDWTIYRFIKTEPDFPYLNIGLKKKFVVDLAEFKAWIGKRTQKEQWLGLQIPSATELLNKGVKNG